MSERSTVYVVDVETRNGWIAVTVLYWHWLARAYVATANRWPSNRGLSLRIRAVDCRPIAHPVD